MSWLLLTNKDAKTHSGFVEGAHWPFPCRFLRTARSFYESLWYLLTYVCTYVEVIFRRSHPTLKLIKQKMSELYKSMFHLFFLFCQNPKMIKLGPKKRFLDLKIKINPFGSHPSLHP